MLDGVYSFPLRLALPNKITLKGSEFPKIIFPLANEDTGVGFDVDVVVDGGGSQSTNSAQGAIAADNRVYLDDLSLRIRFFLSGQGVTASDSEPGILQFTLNNLGLTSDTVTTTLGTGAVLTSTGYPLATDGSLKLVLATVLPNAPELAGSIANGNTLIEMEGTVSPLPSDSLCQNGTLSESASFPGPFSKLSITQIVGGAEVALSGQGVEFGTLEAGKGLTSTITLQLKNEGDNVLALQAIELFDSTQPFHLTGPSQTVLDPGQSTSLQIQFIPQTPLSGASKRFETPLFIQSNDPINPTQGVLLGGTGKAPAGKIQVTVTAPEQIDPDPVDYGSVFYPNNAMIPKKIYKNFRIENVGSADLKIQGIDLLTGDFSITTLRYGINTLVNCGSGMSATKVSDNCSVDAKKMLTSLIPAERQILSLPANSSIHIDVMTKYSPLNFVSPDSASFVIHPQAGASTQITLQAETDSNPSASIRVYADKTPIAAGNDDIEIYNQKRLSLSVTNSIMLKLQNGGAAGGDRLEVKNADVMITGGNGNFTFAPTSLNDLPLIDPPDQLNDGKKNLGTLNYTPPAGGGVESATLTITGHSIDSQGNPRPGDLVYTAELIGGVFEGDLSFKAYRMMSGINNPLIEKPSFTDVDASIAMVLDPNNDGTGIIKKIISRPPKASEINAFQAMNNAQRLAFMKTIAPLRLSTTSLQNKKKEFPNCNEADYNGHLDDDECSYFFASIAHNNSDFSDPLTVYDSDPTLSNYDIDISEESARLTFRNLAVHLYNPEHSLLSSVGVFDERMRLSFTTGGVDPSLIYFSSSDVWSPSLDLNDGVGVNQPPLKAYINQDDNSDGISGNQRGILTGMDVDFKTGHAVIAAVGKFDIPSPFFVENSEIYIIIEGDFCGGNSGIICN